MSDSQGSRGGHASVVFGVPTSARGTLSAGQDAGQERDALAKPADAAASAEEHGQPARSFRSGADGAPAPPTADSATDAAHSVDRRSQAAERDAQRGSRPAEPAGMPSPDGGRPTSARPAAGDTATLTPVGAAATGTPPSRGSWFNRFPARKAAAGPTTAEAPVPDGRNHPTAAAAGGLPGPASSSRGAEVAGVAPSVPLPPGWAGGRHDVPGAPGAGPHPDGFPGGGVLRGAAPGATPPSVGGGPGHVGAGGPIQEAVGRPGRSTYASPVAATYASAPPGSAVPPAPQRPPLTLRPAPDERPSPDTRARPSSAGRTPTASRRARLRLSHVDPKAVLRISFVFWLCVFVVIVVAFAVLWMVLSQLGVFDSVVNTAQTLTDKTGGGIRDWLAFQRVMEIALVVGAVNVVLMTLLSTLGALLYNLCADLVGGVEVTLAER